MISRIKRLNFFSGPACGKTASASFTFYKLKKRHYNIELCREIVKTWAYEGRVPTKLDQPLLFTSQMKEERTYLDNGVDLIVTDSPVLLAVSYGRKYGCDTAFTKYFHDFYIEYDKAYPSLNILLARNGDYNPIGRFENKKEAIKMDNMIKEDMDLCGIEYETINSFDNDKILSTILNRLEN